MLLIFDFDGTIVDSFECVSKKILTLADEFKFKKLNDEEIQHLRDLTSREIIQHLSIPRYKIPQLIFRIRKILCQEMTQLAPFEKIPQVLKKLHHSGCALRILTSNSSSNVSAWLRHHHLQNIFESDPVESRYFSKKNVLKKMIKNDKQNKSEIFYIGDETRDIEAAKQNCINSIAVTWGYNSEKALLRCSPLHIARKPEDILEICGIDSD